MSAFIWLPVTVAASYLIGAIPFGYLVARLRGVDIFTVGSGNIGATNVGRVLGRKFGVLVFVLDFAKGALPVLAATRLPSFGVDVPAEWLGVAAGLSAFLGHLFPVYLGFRGGKGVATGAGIVLVLMPWAALAAFVAWFVVVASSRYVSAASVVGAIVLAGYQIVFAPQPFDRPQLVVTLFCTLAALLIVVRHRTNLRRLWSGNESRLKESTTMFTVSKVVHVLALGLWFGTVAFFTLAGGLMFGSFTELAKLPADKRPMWLPVPEAMEKKPPSPAFPDPLRQEQGSRAFGAAVSPLFTPYYGIQVACGLLAVLTALGWFLSGERGRLQRVRVFLLALALVTAGVGWWMEGVISLMRADRERLSDEVITSAALNPETLAAANQVRADFGKWHGFSLMQNGATLLLVMGAMGLAAQLPSAKPVNHRESDDAEKMRVLAAR